MAELKDRIEGQLKVLDETLDRVQKEAERYNTDARRQGLLHRGFTASLAVLAVAAPALVTYQTQAKSASGWLVLVVILVTAIAGAGTALQGVFRWGERFRRTRLTALELDELYSATQLKRRDIVETDDPVKVFSQISELNHNSASRLQAIVRNHIEAEVALVAAPTSDKESKARQND
jgi:Protein of unknown function (DUF4231)